MCPERTSRQQRFVADKAKAALFEEVHEPLLCDRLRGDGRPLQRQKVERKDARRWDDGGPLYGRSWLAIEPLDVCRALVPAHTPALLTIEFALQACSEQSNRTGTE